LTTVQYTRLLGPAGDPQSFACIGERTAVLYRRRSFNDDTLVACRDREKSIPVVWRSEAWRPVQDTCGVWTPAISISYTSALSRYKRCWQSASLSDVAAPV